MLKELWQNYPVTSGNGNSYFLSRDNVAQNSGGRTVY